MVSSRILFAPCHGDFGMATKLSRIVFTISVAFSLLGDHALAQCELEALLPTEVRTVSRAYGWSVALDGSYLAVGAPASTIDNFEVGAVFVFENGESGWTQQAELLDSVPEFNGLFGTSVSIHGDLLIVGSPMSMFAGNHLGRAFVFRRGAEGWAEEALLVPSLQATGDEFGKSVSVDVDRVAVGAPFFNHVFVFRRFDGSYPCVTDPDCVAVGSPACSNEVCDGVVWVEEAAIAAPSAHPTGGFGFSVSLHGNRLVVGWPNSDFAAEDAGAAYVYRMTGQEWTPEATLSDDEPRVNDWFGASTAIHNDRIVIGAPKDIVNGLLQAGTATVYEYEAPNWIPRVALAASDASVFDLFGTSVALRDQKIAVGANGNRIEGKAGAVYLFRGQGEAWLQERRFTRDRSVGLGSLGGAVALGDVIAVAGKGASLFPTDGVIEPDCNHNEVPDGCEIPGDFDHDAHTSLADIEFFVPCQTGPSVIPEPGSDCCFFDTNWDGSIDLADFAMIQRAFTGAP